MINFRDLSLVIALTFGFCALPAFADEAKELVKAKNFIDFKYYAEAERILKPLADGGNAKAAGMLGNLYLRAPGVSRDYYKARQFLEEASAAGDPAAMLDLSYFSDEGLAGPVDMKRAAFLLEKSADKGYGDAQYLTGLVSIWGYNTKQDFERAIKYLEAGVKNGNGNAECLLAFLYEIGLGVPKDLHKSKTIMQLARIHGCAAGESGIAGLYLEGKGVPKDNSKAIYWLKKASADGNGSDLTPKS